MNDSTLVMRQINSAWMQDGQVTSQAFRPFPKDDGLLSVYDGDMIEPPAAHSHFTTKLGFGSIGIQAVRVDECADLELPARPDPLPDFDEHAVIDFTAHGKKAIKSKAKLLRSKAAERGWLFQA